MGLGVGHIDRCLTGLFTRVVDAVHVFGELLDGGHLGAQHPTGTFAVTLRTEDEGITLGFNLRFGLQVIRHFDLLNRSNFDISGEFGVTQFLTRPRFVLVAKEIKAQQSKGEGIEEDTHPSARSRRLIRVLLRDTPFIVCHS